MLFIEGPKFPDFDFINPKTEKESFIVNGHTLRLQLQAQETGDTLEMDHKEATSMRVWDCSIILAKYLESIYSQAVGALTLLELGAGTGLCGLACSKLPAFKSVILSDIPKALPLLRKHILSNSSTENTSAIAVDWLCPPSPLELLGSYSSTSTTDDIIYPDVIVAADVVWVLELIEPLVKTIAQFMGPSTLFYIAHQTRSLKADEMFFNALESAGIHVLQRVFYRKDNVSIVLMKRTMQI